MRRFRGLYAAAAVLLAAVFFILMRAPMLWATMELDLWWMLPAVSSLVEGKSGLSIASFILAPSPRALEPPVVKAFMLLATPVVGLRLQHLVLLSLVVHCASAVLLYRVVRRFGVGARGGFFTACFYFTVSANFHAFLWPVAFQHLFAVFTILLVLHLYLRTEEQVQDSGGRLPWATYGAALLAALLASLQRSALIVLGLILTDILVRPREPSERIALYRRWFPLFLIGLFYPAWILTLCDDGILTGIILHSDLPAQIKDFLLPAGFTQRSFASGLKYPLLLAAGLAGLLGIGVFLERASCWKRRVNPLLLVAGLVLAGVALFGFQDKRQLFFPYNALVPFVTTLISFLHPVQMALAMDATEKNYTIPAQISFFGFWVSLFLLWTFWVGFVVRKKRLLLFFVWYLLCLSFLLRYQYTFFPVISPSRYFVYLSPFVGATLCSVTVTVYLKLAHRLRLKAFTREILLVGAFVLLCLPNLAAARLASWRGKLVNTYYVYDDLRVSHLIKESLQETLRSSRPASLRVAVEGVEPLPLKALGEASYPYADPARYDHFRIAVREAMGGRLIGQLQINETGHPAPSHRYVIQGPTLLGPEGQRVDAFGRIMGEGLVQMAAGQNQRAIELFKQAAHAKPFLLNYCLSPGLRLEDVRWLTNGEEFHEWLRKLHVRWFTKTEKFEQIRLAMEADLSEYILCLFYLSYLEAEEGREENSRYWISQIYHLDRDPERLISWISESPIVKTNERMGSFAGRFRDGTTFDQPLPWRKDDYGFERFLARLFFQWDFPSTWDLRAGAPP